MSQSINHILFGLTSGIKSDFGKLIGNFLIPFPVLKQLQNKKTEMDENLVFILFTKKFNTYTDLEDQIFYVVFLHSTIILNKSFQFNIVN